MITVRTEGDVGTPPNRLSNFNALNDQLMTELATRSRRLTPNIGCMIITGERKGLRSR
jgi:hypothetical protein